MSFFVRVSLVLLCLLAVFFVCQGTWFLFQWFTVVFCTFGSVMFSLLNVLDGFFWLGCFFWGGLSVLVVFWMVVYVFGIFWIILDGFVFYVVLDWLESFVLWSCRFSVGFEMVWNPFILFFAYNVVSEWC